MTTVCIATYNGEKYIGEQLASILPQLSSEDEVIVSDDGSTDDTLRVVRGFADNRILKEKLYFLPIRTMFGLQIR